MNINIVISGNLTGFSRFFASPEAGDILKEAKFDFDYRNFLTFLGEGEKVYALSFSPGVVAVSVVTRILDSFRRPGVLVVTALVPRGQVVADAFNPLDKSAVYRLLNDVNDKFYEKNFLNGMVNQNPAVLMQDYYTDILRNYTLAGDRQQKNINATIDPSVVSKRIGYIAAPEESMAKYLSSIFRKSYYGYHSVFFGKNAPQNIDEPAEEVKTYHVRIRNGNRPFAGEVRLTDQIPNVMPEQGERDLPNKHFTYRQVLEGEAANLITADIENGDTVVISFNFPREEKRVTFKFFEGAKEVPLQLIRPRLEETDGTSTPIPTDTITFHGKEIYGGKIVRSGNPDYTVDASSAVVDLQRLSDGAVCNIYVTQGWQLRLTFPASPRDMSKPKTVILIKRNDPVERLVFDDVTTSIVEQIPGRRQDWDVEITSDYYETVRVPAGSDFLLKPKKTPDYTGSQLTGGNGGGSQLPPVDGGNSTVSSGADAEAKSEEELYEEKKKLYIKYALFALVGILVCIGGYFGLAAIFGGKPKNIDSGDTYQKTVQFAITDRDGNVIADSIVSGTLEIDVACNRSIIEAKSEGDQLHWNIMCDKAYQDSTIRVIVKVKDSGREILLANDYYKICDLGDDQEVQVKLKTEHLKSYYMLKVCGEVPKDITDQIIDIQKIDADYAALLDSLKEINSTTLPVEKPKGEDKKQQEDKKPQEEKKPEKNAQKQEQEVDDNTIRDVLDLTDREIDNNGGIKGAKHKNTAEKNRIERYNEAVTAIQNGRFPVSSQGLSKSQKDCVNAVNKRYNAMKGKNDDRLDQFMRELTTITSLNQAQKLASKYKPKSK